MDDLKSVASTFGGGLGQMLALNTYDQNKIQQQVERAKLQEALQTSQQNRMFAGQKQPLELEALSAKIAAQKTEHEAAKYKLAVDQGYGVQNKVDDLKGESLAKKQKRLQEVYPQLAAEIGGMPVDERTPYVQKRLLEAGADEKFVAGLFSVPPDMLPKFFSEAARRFAEATPKINSAETIANNRNETAENVAMIKAAMDKYKADLRASLDKMNMSMRLKLAQAKMGAGSGSSGGSKNPAKTFEAASVAQRSLALSLPANSPERAQAEAMADFFYEQSLNKSTAGKPLQPVIGRDGRLEYVPGADPRRTNPLPPSPLSVKPPTGLGVPGASVQGQIGPQTAPKAIPLNDYYNRMFPEKKQ